MFTSNELDFAPNGYDRLPPQNIEAEEVILGGILLDPEAITRICDRLPAEAFYIDCHATIYRAMLDLHSKGKPTDLLSVTSYLSDRIDPRTKESQLKSIGGRNKMATLIDRTVSAVNIDSLSGLVYEKYLRRELIRISHRNIKLAYSTEIELPKILEEAQKSVFDLTQSQSDERPELLHVSVAMQEMYSDMEKKLSGEAVPIQSGFYDLDALTGGFEPNQFVVVGGRPAMGKTAIGVDIAWNIASKQNNQHKPVFFFSLEMDRRQLARRLTTRLSGVEGARLKTPKIMNDDNWTRILMAIETSEESKLYICDHSQMDMFDITGSIRRLIARTGEKPGAIFVDHIHILAGTEEDAKDEQSKISKASRLLKNLSSESTGFGCPVFGLAQLNRAVESRQSKRPMLSDLRSSGSLEQDADFVFLLYRDEYYNPDTPDRGIGEVIVAKGRDSGTGTIKLLYDAPMAQFKNLSKPQY
jgi:replicative DNA helicase